MDDDEIGAPPELPVELFDPEGADDPDARLRYFRDQRRAVLHRRDEPDLEPPPPDDEDDHDE